MTINTLEEQYLEEFDFLISLDEAGRGPWAGPVTVGAVLLDRDHLFKICELEYLNDSKIVSAKKRHLLEDLIKDSVLDYEISDIDIETIDRINILEATKLGVITCLDKLVSKFDKKYSIGILIDGKFNRLELLIKELASFNNTKFEIQTVVDGDALCPSIAAASILAKEHRDNLMRELHKQYPEYAFDKHKGYGTKLHQERLKLFGPSSIHRKSFKPIKELILSLKLS